MNHRLLLLCSVIGLCSTLSAQGKPVKKAARGTTALPLEAELTYPITDKNAHAGAPFVARVLYKWVGPQCTVAAGSTLTGEVVSSTHDTDLKTVDVSLRFHPAQCSAPHTATADLHMYALMIPPSPLSERDFANRGGIYTGYASVIADGTNVAATNRSSPGSLSTDWNQSSAFAQDKLGNAVGRGSVIGNKNISLDMDQPNDSFTLHQKGKKLELLTGTVFLLTPADEADFAKKVADAIGKADFSPSPSTKPSSAVDVGAVESARRKASAALDEQEVCSKDCSVAPSHFEIATSSKSNPGESIELERYGYTRITHHAVERFLSSDSVIYLDDAHLLVTFDRHTIRRRIPGEVRSEYERAVRAVLVDPRTRQVMKVADWKVVGDSQYVWQAGADRVLLHLGNKLFLVNNDLVPIKSFELTEPLAWLSVDPSGSQIAVGLLHEEHNAKLHDLLKHATGVEPEESIAVTFLTSDLQPVGASAQPSKLPAPILADQGEVRLVPETNQRWNLMEIRPDLHQRRIATMLSDCEVRASMPSSQVIFAVGCAHGQNWYRAFRLDGHLIVRGSSSSEEIEQAAIGSSSQRAFAVRVVQTLLPQVYNPEVKQSDVSRESLSIYRTDNGKLLFSQSIGDVPFTQQSFALSPNAEQLAVLGTSSVRLLPVSTSRH